MNLEQKKENLINIARDWYLGKDDGTITDSHFDSLENEIIKDNPSWDYREHLDLQGVTKEHYIPMPKVSKRQEVNKTSSEVISGLIKYKGQYFYIPKYDGGGLTLYYKEGKLVDAITRSSQLEGKRQFSKIKSMVPNTLSNKDIVAIECEGVADLAKGHGGISRQKACGLINSNSLQEECESDLTIVGFRVRYKDDIEPSLENRMKDLMDIPIVRVGKNVTFLPSPINKGDYDATIFNCKVDEDYTMNVLIDGVVIYFDVDSDIYNHYLDLKWIKPGVKSLAQKIYYNDKVTTPVEKMEWNLHQSALKYVPKYIYEKVNLDGSECSRATAGGTAQMIKMKCGAGAKVEVIKAGLTIPQVYRPAPHYLEDVEYRITSTEYNKDPDVTRAMVTIRLLFRNNNNIKVSKFDINELGDLYAIVSLDSYTSASLYESISEITGSLKNSKSIITIINGPSENYYTSEDYSLPHKCGCSTKKSPVLLTLEHDLNGGLYCPNKLCSVNRSILESDLLVMESTLVDLIKSRPSKFITAFLKIPRFGGEKKLANNTSEILTSTITPKGKCVSTYMKYTMDQYVEELLMTGDSLKTTKKYFSLSGIQIKVMSKFTTLIDSMISDELTKLESNAQL